MTTLGPDITAQSDKKNIEQKEPKRRLSIQSSRLYSNVIQCDSDLNSFEVFPPSEESFGSVGEGRAQKNCCEYVKYLYFSGMSLYRSDME